MSVKHVSSGRRLTPEEAAKYRKIREQIDEEKPEIEVRIRTQLAELDRLAGIFAELKRCREARGLSLADMQELTGMDRATISKLENGHRTNCTVDTLVRYAQALGKRLVVALADA